jgi:hypothetical protein
MIHWRTTMCGIIGGTGALIAQFFPEYAKAGAFISAFGIMLQGAFSADSKCTDPTCPKNPGRRAAKFTGALFCLIVLILLLLTP